MKSIIGKFGEKLFTPVDCLVECTVKPSLHTCSHCDWREYCDPIPPGAVMAQHCDQGIWSDDSFTPDPDIGGKTHLYVKEYCDPDEYCIGPRLWDKPKANNEGAASCVKKDKVPNKDSHSQEVITAGDPNIKYGPEGFVLPGQKLNYAVEYENEGEGIAFGVYFTDTLDEDLNDSTLEIGPVFNKDGVKIAEAGTYDPNTRTITWFVGEVGPSEGGYAEFSVNVRDDAPDGIEIINFATVYFPSVPEETRTNGIVSVVRLYPPPIAEANGPYEGEVGSPITLDASDSYDVDGTIISYEWDFNDDRIYDETTTSPIITHTWTEPYSGIVRLRVTDNDNQTATDTTFVEIKAISIQGDLDNDGDIDQNDLNILLSYRNQPASACPECDIDGDGIITVLDARKLVLMCTRPRCATEPE